MKEMIFYIMFKLVAKLLAAKLQVRSSETHLLVNILCPSLEMMKTSEGVSDHPSMVDFSREM